MTNSVHSAQRPLSCQCWGGNRTENGARTFERLATVLRTAYLQDRDPITLLVPLLRAPTPFVLDLIPTDSS